MKLFLCPNLYEPAQREQAGTLLDALSRQGHVCSLSAPDSTALFGGPDRAVLQPADCDLVLSLGGDGSVLRAAQTAISAGRPLLGINSGRLGFLCVASLAELMDRGLCSVLSSACPSERELLTCTVDGVSVCAVNDVVIGKENFGASVDLTVSVPGISDYRVRGDGLVIATPTGSTAYNHSAGGPVLHPACGCLTVTPLCPHRGSDRALVIPSDHPVRVSERRGAASVYADGCFIGRIGDSLTVTRDTRRLILYTPANTRCTSEV